MALKEMVILRGIPGSGKTQLANYLTDNAEEEGLTVQVCSADNFFVGDDGVHRFDGSRLGEAHASCRRAFRQALNDMVDLIIIDNTNVQNWEFEDYWNEAADKGYVVRIEVCPCYSRQQAIEFAQRSVHNVPEATVLRMYRRWEETNY